MMSIRKFAIRSPSVKALLKVSLPALEHLHFPSSQHANARYLPYFLMHHINQLRGLRVDVMDDSGATWYLPNDASQLPLTQLVITGPWESTFSLLTRCCNLTLLSIIFAPVLPRPRDNSPSVLLLPHLRTLKLEAERTDLKLVLDRLRMPQLKELRIVIGNDTDPDNLLCPASYCP